MKRAILFFSTLLIAAQVQALGHLSSIELYDRQAQRTLPVYWHQGKAWVVGQPGNEYQITLRNQSGSDVLAVVSVDGVNVITGETASPAQSGYVIDGGQSVDIAGWRKSMQRTAAFYFTSLGDSYAARTGRPDNVGVIGVALYRRKAEPISIAPQEYRREAMPSSPLASGSARNLQDRADSGARAAPMQEKSLGTGHGRNETSYARQVEFERATRYPTERIEIRYDSYANLVARGVIPREHYGHRREPQAFPGPFVPDPWR
jgi:hypothetical protein